MPPDTGAEGEVFVSLVNVTEFSAGILVSGVAGGVADVQEEPIGPLENRVITFICLDELIIGDPFDPAAAGARIALPDGQTIELDPFVLTSPDFACGDTIEVILSGDRAENFALNVFVQTPAPG